MIAGQYKKQRFTEERIHRIHAYTEVHVYLTQNVFTKLWWQKKKDFSSSV